MYFVPSLLVGFLSFKAALMPSVSPISPSPHPLLPPPSPSPPNFSRLSFAVVDHHSLLDRPSHSQTFEYLDAYQVGVATLSNYNAFIVILRPSVDQILLSSPVLRQCVTKRDELEHPLTNDMSVWDLLLALLLYSARPERMSGIRAALWDGFYVKPSGQGSVHESAKKRKNPGGWGEGSSKSQRGHNKGVGAGSSGRKASGDSEGADVVEQGGVTSNTNHDHDHKPDHDRDNAHDGGGPTPHADDFPLGTRRPRVSDESNPGLKTDTTGQSVSSGSSTSTDPDTPVSARFFMMGPTATHPVADADADADVAPLGLLHLDLERVTDTGQLSLFDRDQLTGPFHLLVSPSRPRPRPGVPVPDPGTADKDKRVDAELHLSLDTMLALGHISSTWSATVTVPDPTSSGSVSVSGPDFIPSNTTRSEGEPGLGDADTLHATRLILKLTYLVAPPHHHERRLPSSTDRAMAVRTEVGVLTGSLAGLQGTVVPVFYGLWSSPDGRWVVMVVEHVLGQAGSSGAALTEKQVWVSFHSPLHLCFLSQIHSYPILSDPLRSGQGTELTRRFEAER